MSTAAPVRSRTETTEPRIIQRHEQSEVIPRQSEDRVNSLPTHSQLRQMKTKDGRLVYIDSQGREVRPAGGRQELQRGRYDSELGPATDGMAKMRFDESRDSRGTETAAKAKGEDPASANLRPEQPIDRRMASVGGGNQQRRKYSIDIKGTAGDTESLDGGELVPVY